MRLKFLASTLVRGGAETMAAALSRGLMQRGHEVEWVTLREPGTVGEALREQMPFRANAAPAKTDWLNLRAIVATLKGAQGLYVLDHDNAAVVASLAGRLAHIPKRFLAIHTTGRWGGGRSLGRAMRLTVPAYTAVLALSPSHRQYLVGEEGLDAEGIRILPNGVDLALFRDLPSRRAMRDELGLPREARVMGSVAMLRPEKNHALLLEVAQRLETSVPNLHTVLVGNGPERENLERRVADMGLRGRVHFLGRRNDALRVMRAFDLLVLCSHPLVETQPLAVLEAMGAGVPVVASRVGDLGDMLAGGAGRLVEPGDLEGFCTAAANVLSDEDHARSLRDRGLERVKDYSLEASLDVFEGLLGEGQG